MGRSEKRDLMAIMAVAAILLAVVRAMSFLGMWGDTHTSLSESIAWMASLALGGVCLVIFGRFALIAVQERPVSMRFQPAILVTLRGMFAMALHVEPNSVEAMFLSTVVQLDELFAHLLFWCVVIAALDALDVPSYRVVGFACAVYAGVSIVWVVLMSRATVVDTTLVLLAAYAVVVFAMRGELEPRFVGAGRFRFQLARGRIRFFGVAASVEQVVADELMKRGPTRRSAFML